MLLNSLSPSMALFCLMAALLLALSAQAAPAVEKVANGAMADNEKLLAVEKASNSHVPSHVPGVHRMKVRRVKLPADHPLLKQQQKNGIGHFFSQLAKKGAPAPGEEILPVTQDVWGILGVVDIELGTPPQEFTFWLDPNSPDMFVLSEDVVDVQGRELTDERNEFNPRRSKSFSDASSRPWSQTCEGAAFAFSGNECMVASGRNATDMLRIGEMARKMNFGLVDRVDVMQSGYKETTAFPDFFGIDGKLGLSGMRPTSGIPSALEQLEPLKVLPMFTFFTYPDDFTETELVLGSDEIEGRCASMDYQHFPVTQLSAGPTAARHAWLQSVGIKYTGENATNSRVFRTGAWFAFYQMTPYSQDRAGSIPIYGPEWAVRQIANSINGTSTYGEGFYTLPCDVRHLSSPSIVLTFGGRGQPSGQWTLRPKDYVLGPYKDSKSCYLAFTYNKGGSQDYQGPQDVWFSLEQHTGFCVNYNFQAGTMGIATPTF